MASGGRLKPPVRDGALAPMFRICLLLVGSPTFQARLGRGVQVEDDRLQQKHGRGIDLIRMHYHAQHRSSIKTNENEDTLKATMAQGPAG